jgi:hypothetical protein
MIDAAKIADAKRELHQKTLAFIQVETAWAWATRALAAKELFNETGEGQWMVDAVEYHHEALEHAALAAPGLCEQVRAALW